MSNVTMARPFPVFGGVWATCTYVHGAYGFVIAEEGSLCPRTSLSLLLVPGTEPGLPEQAE